MAYKGFLIPKEIPDKLAEKVIDACPPPYEYIHRQTTDADVHFNTGVRLGYLAAMYNLGFEDIDRRKQSISRAESD